MAQDVDGQWWDCGEELVLKDFPSGGVEGVAFNDWLNRRIQQVQKRDRETAGKGIQPGDGLGVNGEPGVPRDLGWQRNSD